MAEIKSLEENNAPRKKREKLITGEARPESVWAIFLLQRMSGLLRITFSWR